MLHNLDKAGWIQTEDGNAYVQYFGWNSDFTWSEQRQAILPAELAHSLMQQLRVSDVDRLSGQRVLFRTDVDFDQLVLEVELLETKR
jgi:hypothetical protein